MKSEIVNIVQKNFKTCDLLEKCIWTLMNETWCVSPPPSLASYTDVLFYAVLLLHQDRGHDEALTSTVQPTALM